MTGKAAGGSIGGSQPPFPRSEASGYHDRFVAAAAAYANPEKPASEASRISAIVQPISTVVESVIFRLHGFVFGCNEKPTSENCGKIRAKILCPVDESHRPYFKHERCNDPLCPVCYPKYVSRIADAVTARIMGFLSVFAGIPVYHLIFWPDSLTGYTNLKEAMRDAKFLLESMGAKMAVVWYHPYRIRDDIKKRLRRYKRENGIADFVGFWQLAHDDVLGLGGLAAYIVYGPHFHAIASGYLENADDYARRGIGGYKKGRYLNGEANIHRVAYYISSHACREATKSTVRYFGDISYSKLARDEGQEIIEDIVCEICGAPLKEHYCDDVGVIGAVAHEHVTRKTILHRYWERGKKPPFMDGVLTGEKNTKKKHLAEFKEQCERARLDRLAMGIT
jgi:hypothetical protein